MLLHFNSVNGLGYLWYFAPPTVVYFQVRLQQRGPDRGERKPDREQDHGPSTQHYPSHPQASLQPEEGGLHQALCHRDKLVVENSSLVFVLINKHPNNLK